MELTQHPGPGSPAWVSGGMSWRNEYGFRALAGDTQEAEWPRAYKTQAGQQERTQALTAIYVPRGT